MKHKDVLIFEMIAKAIPFAKFYRADKIYKFV